MFHGIVSHDKFYDKILYKLFLYRIKSAFISRDILVMMAK